MSVHYEGCCCLRAPGEHECVCGCVSYALVPHGEETHQASESASMDAERYARLCAARGRREELDRVIRLVGPQVYRDDPVVHACLYRVLDGIGVEQALADTVRVLAEQNAMLVAHLVRAAQLRPTPGGL